MARRSALSASGGAASAQQRPAGAGEDLERDGLGERRLVEDRDGPPGLTVDAAHRERGHHRFRQALDLDRLAPAQVYLGQVEADQGGVEVEIALTVAVAGGSKLLEGCLGVAEGGGDLSFRPVKLIERRGIADRLIERTGRGERGPRCGGSVHGAKAEDPVVVGAEGCARFHFCVDGRGCDLVAGNRLVGLTARIEDQASLDQYLGEARAIGRPAVETGGARKQRLGFDEAPLVVAQRGLQAGQFRGDGDRGGVAGGGSSAQLVEDLLGLAKLAEDAQSVGVVALNPQAEVAQRRIGGRVIDLGFGSGDDLARDLEPSHRLPGVVAEAPAAFPDQRLDEQRAAEPRGCGTTDLSQPRRSLDRAEGREVAFDLGAVGREGCGEIDGAGGDVRVAARPGRRIRRDLGVDEALEDGHVQVAPVATGVEMAPAVAPKLAVGNLARLGGAEQLQFDVRRHGGTGGSHTQSSLSLCTGRQRFVTPRR